MDISHRAGGDSHSPSLTSTFSDAYTAQDIANIVRLYPHHNTIIYVDIDDTVITPQSHTFRAPPFNGMMDRIKNNKDTYENYAAIVSNWRLQRQPMLIDAAWPDVLNDLKMDYTVYALTKMDTGTFGAIPSMEAWRHKELTDLGVIFTDSGPLQSGNGSSFYHGIMITGPNSKSETLKIFKDTFINAHTVIMIDDRASHVADIGQLCAHHNINFHGIHFKGLSRLEGSPDADVASFQEHHLIQTAQWVEDDVARTLMKK